MNLSQVILEEVNSTIMGCAQSDVAKLPTKVIRVGIVGERGSGKSSLISAFLMRKFDTTYTPTTTSNIGVKAYTFRDSSEVTTFEVWELNDAVVVPPSFNLVILALDVGLPAIEMTAQLSQYISRLNLHRRLPTFAVAVTKIDTVSESPSQLLLIVKKAINVPPCVRVYLTSAESMYGIDDMFKDVIKPNVASQPVSRATSMAGG